MAGRGGFGHILYGLIFGTRVVLGDDNHQPRENQTHNGGTEKRTRCHAFREHCRIGEDKVAHKPEGNGGDHARDNQAAVESRHDLLTRDVVHKERADDACDDGNGPENEGVFHETHGVARCGERTDHHRRDKGHRVRFKKVSGHTGAVTDVVAHVIGDHGGVTRVVFGNAGFHLAHKVSADVGALREDAAAKTRKD